MKKIIVILTVVFCLSSTAGFAAQFTFFGEDINANTEPERDRLFPPYPNAGSAETAFLSNLVGVGTEDFEGLALGAPPPGGLPVSFPGAGTATLLGSGFVGTPPFPGFDTDLTGIYPISGSQYWDSGSLFNITSSAPIAAFGFYGVDIGDFG